MEISIEQAGIEDAGEILELQKLAYASEGRLYNDPAIPPLVQTLEEIRADFERQFFLKAVLEGEIVGSVRAYEEDGTCYIGRLIVLPRHQGGGIGSRLLEEIEERFAGAGRFELFTGHRSEKPLHIYEKKGYSVFRNEYVHDDLTVVYLEKTMKAKEADHANLVLPDYMEAGRGLPLILIPGLEGAKEFWEPQMEVLADSYRVIAMGLPVREPSLESTITDYTRCVIDLMDGLGLKDAVIVGESFGGMVAQEMALSCPERVAGIVLCNTMDRPRRGGFGFNAFTLATLLHNLVFIPFLPKRARKAILRRVGKHRGFVLDPSPRNDVLIDHFIEHGADCGMGAYIDRVIACAKASFTSRLTGVSMPALVLRGEEDRLLGTDGVVQLVGRIPNARLALIEGGGHCCTYTVPDASNRAILDWLVRIGYYVARSTSPDSNPYIGIT